MHTVQARDARLTPKTRGTWVTFVAFWRPFSKTPTLSLVTLVAFPSGDANWSGWASLARVTSLPLGAILSWIPSLPFVALEPRRAKSPAVTFRADLTCETTN